MSPFLRAYIDCALWSTNDNANESGGEPLDRNYSASDLAPETLASFAKDCEAFQDRAGSLLDGLADSRAGFLFWLNRNGHGSGFWDEDTIPDETGKALSALCDWQGEFGEVNLYVGDDGRIYA